MFLPFFIYAIIKRIVEDADPYKYEVAILHYKIRCGSDRFSKSVSLYI